MVKTSNVVYKLLVVGVIILFIVVGIQPAFAIKPKLSDSEEDCGICPKVSNQHLIIIKKLFYRLEKYKNILPFFLKYNPEIMDIRQDISNEISSNIDSNGIMWNVICELIIIFVESVKEFRDKYFNWAGYINWWLTVISFSTYLFWKAYCPSL